MITYTDTYAVGTPVTITYPNGRTLTGIVGQETYRQGIGPDATEWAHVTLPEGSEYLSAIVPTSYLATGV